MTDSDEITFEVSTKGTFRHGQVEWASDEIRGVIAKVSDPVLHLELRLTHEPDHPRVRPVIAEATIDIDGTPVRAQVAAPTLPEAVELLVDRLTQRVVRHEQRRHRKGRRPDGAHGRQRQGWHHGDLPVQRPEYFPRPVDEREVVSRKTFALSSMTIDDAVEEMALLGHDFLLFREATSDRNAVVTSVDDQLVLWHPDPDTVDASGLVDLTIRSGVPTLTLDGAVEWLDTTADPFVFHRPSDDAQGRVLYRRYDGHYGLIEPA